MPSSAEQLRNLALRQRRHQGRFGAEIKTPECCQYWLPGFGRTAPADSEKCQEIHVSGRNFHWRFWPETFCILARLRRVLRTTFGNALWERRMLRTHPCAGEPQVSTRRSKFRTEIFIEDFGRSFFAFWPDCGECFAPLFWSNFF